jgi:hypothetical protein
MVHDLVHGRLLSDPVLSQFNLSHTFMSYFFLIHFNIILHFYSELLSGLFLSTFLAIILYECLISHRHARCSVHLIFLDLIILIILAERTNYEASHVILINMHSEFLPCSRV